MRLVAVAWCLLAVICCLSVAIAAVYEGWLEKHGVKHDALGLAEFEGFGDGYEAKRNIKEGEVIMSVPIDTFLNSRVARAGVLRPLSEQYPEINDQLVLALSLLAEKFAGPENSKYAEWLESLPRKYNTPLTFSEEELKELKGSSLLSLTKTRKEQMETTYTQLSEFFAKDANMTDRFPADKFTADEFKWAVATVTARSFTLTLSDGSVVCMMPGLDMINHGSTPTDFKFNNETKTFDVVTLSSHEKGDQVFISTGKKTNLDLLLSNGYVIDNPDFDIVLISSRMNENAEHRELKTTVMRMKELNEFRVLDGFFYLSLDSFPVDLVAALRIQLSQGSELLKLAADNSTETVSTLENELAAYRTVLSAVETMFKEYETSIEEDEKLLKHSLTPNVRSAVRLRMGEKKVLQSTVSKLVTAWRDFLINDFPPKREEKAASAAEAVDEVEEADVEAPPSPSKKSKKAKKAKNSEL